VASRGAPHVQVQLIDSTSESWLVDKVKSTVVGVLISAIGFSLLMFDALAQGNPFSSFGVLRAVEAAPRAGRDVLNEMGTVLSVYVTVLVGFYVAVLGGQLRAPVDHAERARRMLGSIAVMMAGSLISLYGICVIYCVSGSPRIGILCALTPICALVVGLAIQVGRLNVYSRAQKLKMAYAEKERLDLRKDKFEIHGDCSIWVVAPLTVLVGGVPGFFTIAAMSKISGSLSYLFVLFMFMIILLVSALCYCKITWQISRSKIEKLLGALVLAALLLDVVYLMLDFMVKGLWGMAWGFGVSLLLCTLSATWPRRKRGARTLSWTLAGCISRFTFMTLERRLKWLSVEIDKLKPVPDGRPGRFRAIRSRLRNAIVSGRGQGA